MALRTGEFVIANASNGKALTLIQSIHILKEHGNIKTLKARGAQSAKSINCHERMSSYYTKSKIGAMEQIDFQVFRKYSGQDSPSFTSSYAPRYRSI